MKFDNIRAFNFENALRGMRNPKNSWELSDSSFGLVPLQYVDEVISDLAGKYNWFGADGGDTATLDEIFDAFSKNVITYINEDCCEYAAIGPKDMQLAQTLIKAGPEHRKFMRQIFVTVDITAPLYWWKEFDTYKVGTVANSTSTMHKLTSKPITLDCFEIDDFYNVEYPLNVQREELKYPVDPNVVQMILIPYLEYLRQLYLDTQDKKVWKELIRWLPESWLQTRTVTMSYENLLAICSKSQRRFHKLTEWSNNDPDMGESFIKMARELPYAKEFIFIDEIE